MAEKSLALRGALIAAIAAVIVFALASIAPRWSGEDDEGERDHEEHYAATSGELLPLEDILRLAREEVAGKVLEVELDRDDDRVLYEVEVLDANGDVIELKYDARTGTLLKKETN